MNPPTLATAHRRCGLRLVWVLVGSLLCTGCLTPSASLSGATAPAPRTTATADIATFVIYPEARQTLTAAPAQPARSALLATLADYAGSPDDDPTGAKAAALVTLHNFLDVDGPYRGAWWFEGDPQNEMNEVLALILFTEGSSSLDVRKAVAARFLWYCGGQNDNCQGSALVNFLAYFQGWREPWMVSRGFTNVQAKGYLALADDIVHQRGIIREWIPGAEWFVQDPGGLMESGPVRWEATPFHFANVHPTWDSYLRRSLGRAPNGPNRLWVLTVGEAVRVCGDGFVCPDMTQARP